MWQGRADLVGFARWPNSPVQTFLPCFSVIAWYQKSSVKLNLPHWTSSLRWRWLSTWNDLKHTALLICRSLTSNTVFELFSIINGSHLFLDPATSLSVFHPNLHFVCGIALVLKRMWEELALCSQHSFTGGPWPCCGSMDNGTIQQLNYTI